MSSSSSLLSSRWNRVHVLIQCVANDVLRVRLAATMKEKEARRRWESKAVSEEPTKFEETMNGKGSLT